jgi:hypothetical protein
MGRIQRISSPEKESFANRSEIRKYEPWFSKCERPEWQFGKTLLLGKRVGQKGR